MTHEELKLKLTEKLRSFIKKKETENRVHLNEWLYIEEIGLQTYVRYSTRFIDDRRCEALDRAYTCIAPKFRGRGFYSVVFEVFEEVAKEFGLLLYIESVISNIVKSKIKRSGYLLKSPAESSYYKDFSDANQICASKADSK